MLSRTTVIRSRRIFAHPSASFRPPISPPEASSTASSGWHTPWSPAQPILAAAAGTGAGTEIGGGTGTSRPSPPQAAPDSSSNTGPLKDYTAVHKRLPGKGSGPASTGKNAPKTPQSKPASSRKSAEINVRLHSMLTDSHVLWSSISLTCFVFCFRLLPGSRVALLWRNCFRRPLPLLQ